MTDLVVVGGGPVGLGTAVTAAQAGLDVTLFDPRGAPVDKACGEGLMPSAVEALARIGVHPDGVPFAGIAYVAGGRRAQARFRAGPGLGVRRTVLSSALAARADELGVRRVARRVTDVRLMADAVEVEGVRASWLVAADGLHSPLRRHLGLDRPAAKRVRFGLRRHLTLAPWSDLVEVHWASDAEAYVTPVAPDCVGIAILCGGGGPYDRWLDRFPALRERIGDAPSAGPVLGAGPLRQRARARRSGRAFLVGDAAGYVDALTGEGIAVGLAAAQALVRCLESGRPEAYEEQWRQATRRYRALTSSLLWATQRPVLRAALVPAAARARPVFGAVVDALA
jgi:flavin-dependent dehydrogenase